MLLKSFHIIPTSSSYFHGAYANPQHNRREFTSVLVHADVGHELSVLFFWKPYVAIHALKKFVLQGKSLPSSGKAHLFCSQGSLVPQANPPEAESKSTLPMA